MEPVPTLREVFAALAGDSADPAAVLEAAGHGGLPEHLVAEAIVNYADAAPVEVAEHLSPFVVAHSGVPLSPEGTPGGADTGDGLALLQAAPAPHDDVQHDLQHEDPGHSLLDAAPAAADHATDHATDHLGDHPADPPAGPDAGHEASTDLFFGAGQPTGADGVHAAAQPAPDTAPADDASGHDAHGLDHSGWIDLDPADHVGADDWAAEHATGDTATAPEPVDEHHHDEGPLDHGAGA